MHPNYITGYGTNSEATVIANCKLNPFSILCDESNDRGANKFFAILVCIFEEGSRSVKTRFLDMSVVNIGTGQNLYDARDNCLRYFSFLFLLMS